jgi:hypothetical protein
MKTSTKLIRNIGMLALLVSTHVQAYPGESIDLDPATGDYTITYRSSDPAETRLMQTTFVPSTKIVPIIRSTFRPNERGGITYRYTVSNGAMAKQPIAGVLIENVANPLIGERAKDFNASQEVRWAIYSANKAATPAPKDWSGDIIRSKSRVAWGPDVMGGISAGQTLSGYGFASMDLPGIGNTNIYGAGAMFGYPDEGPADDSTVLAELERMRDNDYIAKHAAIPTITVPEPFDPAVLLDRIRIHVATWPSKQLVDPAFAVQLDRYMVAAADAYRLNNTKAGKEHLQTLRKLLSKEHHHVDHDDEDNDDTDEHKTATRVTIDRLAARVLDFDLRYVLKRMEHEHKEGERKKGRD